MYIDQHELWCSDEFRFEGIYPRVTILKLRNSYIAQRRIVERFPNLQEVHVTGIYRTDECRVLRNSSYTLYGCAGRFLSQEI